LNKRLFFASALATLFSISGCKAQDSVASYSIVGRIDKETKNRFEKNIHKVKYLQITSQGGDIVSSIEIGKLVSKYKLRIVVNKYCLSACAQYVLPAAKNIEISNNAIVGFHNSATAVSNLLNQSDLQHEAEKYSEMVELEKSYYNDLGLIIDSGNFWSIASVPTCIVRSNATIPLALIATKYEFVVLQRDDLEGWLGQKVVGFVPENRMELMASIKKSIPARVITSFVFFDKSLESPHRLSECSK
jgi:hypothetical protein